MNDVLRMSGIVKVFAGVHALNGVDFSLREGEVHALIGENGAGKSTLMKILLGIYQSDEGSIILKNKEVRFKNPAEALSSGISMIHQEISLVPEMTVAENIWLGREKQFKRGVIINVHKRIRETEKLLSKLNLPVNANAKVKDLSVASMQLVELARAISCNSGIIIMDEPTSALTNKEIDILYEIIEGLVASGTSVIFISHKLEEIFRVCRRVTVLRDGNLVGTKNCDETDIPELIGLIAGRKAAQAFVKKRIEAGDTVLEARRISQEGMFENISFSVRAGEILGFAGLMGSGRTEIMQALFGVTKLTNGEMLYMGKSVAIRNPGDAVANNIGMVTEDRLRSGSIYTMSVMQNATLVSLKNLASKMGFFSKRKEKAFFKDMAKQLNIKYSSENELIGQLSGGNQQKVIFARWLSSRPKVLILDEPTRGIDVGAKHEIYRLIERLAEEGLAILLISSEMPELLSLSDRIIVIRNGRKVFECTGEEATQAKLIAHAFGIRSAEERRDGA